MLSGKVENIEFIADELIIAQYADYVEITAPLSLREKVGSNLISAARKYSD